MHYCNYHIPTGSHTWNRYLSVFIVRRRLVCAKADSLPVLLALHCYSSSEPELKDKLRPCLCEKILKLMKVKKDN